MNSEGFKAQKVSDGLVSGFAVTDKAIVDQANSEGWMNGSTAVVGIVADGRLHMANIGDSEAILVAVKYAHPRSVESSFSAFNPIPQS